MSLRSCIGLVGIVAAVVPGAVMVRAADLGPLPPPAIYQRLVDPTEYPAYERRDFKVPSWQTFGERPQLVGWRAGIRDNVTRELIDDLPAADAVVTGRNWFLGRVYQPNIMFAQGKEPDFIRDVARLEDLGLYVFNVGGYGPGAPQRGGYGQLQVEPERLATLEKTLGDRWLGFDLGEQDGRYHNGFEGRQLPAARTAVGQHKLFRDWCDRVIDDQGGRISLLSVLWGWHYPAQDGAMTLIGAESEDKFGITNPQVQYAFLRGAGKQYGVLWFGNVATFSTFGATAWTSDGEGRLTVQPGGGSGNLMRRLFLQHWLWNCCILSYERATLAGPTGWTPMDKTPARISPIGRVQLATERLIRSGFAPGVMQTPVAILQDYFSGWMPARTNIVQFQAFNGLPYRPGDHLTDALLSAIFPGYDNCGWYFDERGGMCPTPYGDIADCLLSDAPAEVLARYGLVLVSGIDTDTRGVRDRLDRVLASGGTVVVTGGDAARLWPEHVGRDTLRVPAGAVVRWQGSGREHREEAPFDLQVATLPTDATILASCDAKPCVARLASGKGALILLLAATGLNADPAPVPAMKSPVFGGGENTPLVRPHRMLGHVAAAYAEALDSQRLFTAGDALTVTSCRRGDGTWVVGVANPGLESRPLEITSHVGPIAGLREVDLGCDIHDLPGYWPHQWGKADPRTKQRRDDLGELPGQLAPSDDHHIRGGDMRFFEVTLAETIAAERPHLPLPVAVEGRRLALPDLVTLRDRLLAWPMFASYFDGVAIGSQALLDCDPQWLAARVPWLARHGIKILVDARTAAPEVAAEVFSRAACLGGLAEVVVGAKQSVQGAGLDTGAVRLRTPAEVHWHVAGRVPDRGRGRIEVLEADWNSWDAVYADVKRAWLDERPGRIVGPPGPGPEAAQQNHEPPAEAARRFVAVHGIGDLAQAVAARPGLRDHFGGLLVDAEWLESRSDAAVSRDAAWLGARSLGTIVDFSRSINRFPDLTFASGVPHQREESVRRIRAVLDKMKLLGCRAAVITSHEDGPTGSDWDDQRRGIKALLEEAAARGITVHWRTSALRPPKRLDKHAALVADLRKAHANLRIAACTVDEPDPQRLEAALGPAGPVELWLLAAPPPRNQKRGVSFLPLAQLPRGGLESILAAAAGATVVFDADYLSWEEALADVTAAAKADAPPQAAVRVQAVKLTQADQQPQADQLAQPFPVRIDVNAAGDLGPLPDVWRFFGADEPNYATMPHGKKLLGELGELRPKRVFFRAHNLLTTGDGTPALKWGSTNAYTEDVEGRPVYDWKIVDGIFDAYLARGVRPYAQIGFMPKALSVKPEPYGHDFTNDPRPQSIYNGWAYPPRDFSTWERLVEEWVRHCVDRYGADEVATWYWQTWNEPNIDYWKGTREEFFRLHDHAIAAVRRVLPAARVGGPDSASDGGAFMDEFLDHCLHGTNFATGERGTPLDFVSFHAKGQPKTVDGRVQMGIRNHLQTVERGFRRIAKHPELHRTPIVIGESDPEGCAACQGPHLAYRNGTMYSSYTAASFPRKVALADRVGVNLEGVLTWAFEFENTPWFAGYRTLATNGVDKPVLNVFRMWARMAGRRLPVESDAEAPLDAILAGGVRGRPDVAAIASRDGDRMWVMAWHYHDDDLPGPDAAVTLRISGWAGRACRPSLYRIDEDHSNAFTRWKQMGSPQQPTAEQVSELERRGGLETADPPEVRADNAALEVTFRLPRAGVSLLEWPSVGVP